MIKVKGIDHVALNVRDIDKSVEFYTKVLGLKITEREPSKPGIEYFLDCGPSLIGIIQAKDFGREHLFHNDGLGANHFSLRVDAADFDGIIQQLVEQRIRIEFAKKRAKSWSLYFYDLDGNKLEITAWPHEDGLGKDKITTGIYDPKTNSWQPLP